MAAVRAPCLACPCPRAAQLRVDSAQTSAYGGIKQSTAHQDTLGRIRPPGVEARALVEGCTRGGALGVISPTVRRRRTEVWIVINRVCGSGTPARPLAHALKAGIN